MWLDSFISDARIETLEKLIKKNLELIDMKYNDFNSNVTFGRTLSLGQWFGLFLGMKIAKDLEGKKELSDYEVLIDTCLTTLKKYKAKKEDSNRMVRRNRYPDILIVKRVSGDTIKYNDFIKDNKKVFKKHDLKDIPDINLYDAKALIELKIDPGYVDIDTLETSLNELNNYINKKEEFSFKKIYKEGDEGEYSLYNIVRFNSPSIHKYLVLATEANHDERVHGIDEICTKAEFKYIPFTGKEKHIRDFKYSDLTNLKNLI